jgi:hypothetical protein
LAGTSLRLRGYHSKVEIVGANGDHVRYVTAAFAAALVQVGRAAIAEGNGKVRSVKLVETASSHAHMIGPPGDGRAAGTRFYRKAKLDTPAVVWEHHPRCTYEEPD